MRCYCNGYVEGDAMWEEGVDGWYCLPVADLLRACGQLEACVGVSVGPSPATHVILAQLKAGETVHQAGELPKTLRVSTIH